MPRVLRLPTVGAGTHDDPVRVNLPTYGLIEVSPDGKTALVVVADAEFPDDAAWDDVPLLARGELDMSRLPVTALDRWHDHLDQRYRERAGQFRPRPARTAGRNGG